MAESGPIGRFGVVRRTPLATGLILTIKLIVYGGLFYFERKEYDNTGPVTHSWIHNPVCVYSCTFCVQGLPKFLDFGYFVLICGKLIKNKKSWSRVARTCLSSWTELPIVWLIIGSDNIFIFVVNEPLECMLLCTTRWRKIGIGWNFGFKNSFVDIYLLMTLKDGAKIREYTFN